MAKWESFKTSSVKRNLSHEDIETLTGMSTLSPSDLKETVVSLLRGLKPPVHIAALSMAYAKQQGRSIKLDYKGGMLKYVKAELPDAVVVMGEGNDTFLRLATPQARAAQWVRQCVETHGPILASMIGRLYHETHGRHFGESFSEGLGKFMRAHLADALTFEPQKGQEVLVDLERRGAPRAFLAADSKKQLKKRTREDAATDPPQRADTACSSQANGGYEGAVGGRIGERGLPGAYAISAERVLVLGEADFSWAASLLPLCKPDERRRRLTATSFDERTTLDTKYGAAVVGQHVAALRGAGASVLHGIDATALSQHEALQTRAPFDQIVFVFPHAGSEHGLAASIDENRALLRGLLREAPAMLADSGEVHITLVQRYPYTAWLHGLTKREMSERAGADAGEGARPSKKVRSQLGANQTKGELRSSDEPLPWDSLTYLGSVPFPFDAFGQYQHRATSRVNGGDAGALDVATQCRTHVWSKLAAAKYVEDATCSPSIFDDDETIRPAISEERNAVGEKIQHERIRKEKNRRREKTGKKAKEDQGRKNKE